MVSILAGSMSGERPEPQSSHTSISQSGNGFLETCKHVDDEYDSRYSSDVFVCLGFVQGFVQGIYVSDEFRGVTLDKRMTCPPEEVTTGQFVRIIKKYIDEHPEKAHMGTRYLASEVLIQAFPCKK
jgi:hypothetical protein